MFSLLLLLVQVPAALACAPTVPPGTAVDPNTVVKTTVVTTQAYHPNTNRAYLQEFQNKFNAYIKQRGLGEGYGLTEASVVDVKGKFAVVYNFETQDCAQVRNLASEMKKGTDFIDHFVIKCPNKPEFSVY
ncbi:unnamed protein product [Heligmosomoides polygyrus]|uniref:Uncharacterized protein n=1 Tax=Heligmosomoides polygyrus TaxID=6339 RepID=A0A183FIT3_HELPZ|nr:unnamed protein product [Heligmosomoides polygyrus]